MPKYVVTCSTLFVDGVKYRRGDVVETDADFGTRLELLPEAPVEEKPKRKRRTKAEIEAENEGI